MAMRGVRTASVNTQQDNSRALSLYKRLGFAPIEPGLAVLRYELSRT